MNTLGEHQELLPRLMSIVSAGQERTLALQKVADLLRETGNYRWVGLYDVDTNAGLARNVVWSGPGEPEFPTFPLTRGLTGGAIAARKTVNVGNVANDPRYLTAFGSTQSEIIVPVFDKTGDRVVGTIDVESEKADAFTPDVQGLLESCCAQIRLLWSE